LLESIEGMMQDLTEQLVGFADALGAVSKNAQDVENSLGNDKTKKGLKSIDGMLMNMAKSSASAIALEQLMKLIEPFLLLLEPLGVIFDILGALLTVFTGEIMKSLFDALQPLFEILIALMPLFKVLGQLFGMIIEVGLEPLKVILEVLGTILKPFMPMLEKLSPIFELLGGVVVSPISIITTCCCDLCGWVRNCSPHKSIHVWSCGCDRKLELSNASNVGFNGRTCEWGYCSE